MMLMSSSRLWLLAGHYAGAAPVGKTKGKEEETKKVQKTPRREGKTKRRIRKKQKRNIARGPEKIRGRT
uniref:Putative secreted protein n=1 Tax=Xenopsylla cheopis TaxID=163159 RepID=A0A6M2E1R8_XENCH